MLGYSASTRSFRIFLTIAAQQWVLELFDFWQHCLSSNYPSGKKFFEIVWEVREAPFKTTLSALFRQWRLSSEFFEFLIFSNMVPFSNRRKKITEIGWTFSETSEENALQNDEFVNFPRVAAERWEMKLFDIRQVCSPGDSLKDCRPT